MRKQIRTIIAGSCALMLFAAFALCGCSQNPETPQSNQEEAQSSSKKVQVQVLEPEGLSGAMQKIQQAYIADGHSNISFENEQYKTMDEFNNALSTSIDAGLVITDSKNSMDAAVEKNYVDQTTRVDMLKGQLVMVASESSNLADVTLDGIAAGKYTIAACDETQFVGNCTAQALSTVGAYVPTSSESGKQGKDISGKGGSYKPSAIKDGKVALEASAESVCELVKGGSVDVGFVYASDAERASGVKVVGTAAASTHKNIVYPGALVKECKSKQETQDFLNWCLSNKKAKEIWEESGFEVA